MGSCVTLKPSQAVTRQSLEQIVRDPETKPKRSEGKVWSGSFKKVCLNLVDERMHL
jgi:hypothetical protein